MHAWKGFQLLLNYVIIYYGKPCAITVLYISFPSLSPFTWVSFSFQYRAINVVARHACSLMMTLPHRGWPSRSGLLHACGWSTTASTPGLPSDLFYCPSNEHQRWFFVRLSRIWFPDAVVADPLRKSWSIWGSSELRLYQRRSGS